MRTLTESHPSDGNHVDELGQETRGARSLSVAAQPVSKLYSRRMGFSQCAHTATHDGAGQACRFFCLPKFLSKGCCIDIGYDCDSISDYSGGSPSSTFRAVIISFLGGNG